MIVFKSSISLPTSCQMSLKILALKFAAKISAYTKCGIKFYSKQEKPSLNNCPKVRLKMTSHNVLSHKRLCNRPQSQQMTKLKMILSLVCTHFNLLLILSIFFNLILFIHPIIELSLDMLSTTLLCIECRKVIKQGHFLKYLIRCEKCPYSTYCHQAMKSHELQHLNSKITSKFILMVKNARLACLCGHSSNDGNLMGKIIT